jgi:hypothetical protein
MIPISEPAPSNAPTPWSRFKMGAMDPLYGGAQVGARMMAQPGGGDPMAALAPAQPDETAEVDKAVNDRETAYQEQRHQAAVGANDPEAVGMQPRGVDWWRLAGNVASPFNLAAGAGSPGSSLGEAAILGAGRGALTAAMQPVTGDNFGAQKAAQIGMGAGAGTLFSPVGRLVAGSRPADVSTLANAGVDLTPAQAGGNVAKSLTAIGQKMPIVGGMLDEQRRSAMDSFTPAVLNQVLQPIGASVGKDLGGHDAFQAAHTAVSDFYDDLMPRLQYTPSNDFLDGLSGIEGKVPLSQRGNFNLRIAPLFTDSLSGDALKTVDSDLATYSRRYINARGSRSGYAINDARQLLHGRLAEVNPDAAADLKSANRAAAMLRVADDAVSPTSEGKVTPGRILSATSKNSTDSQFAQGKALLQPFAETAQRVMGSGSGSGNRPLTVRDLLLTDIVGPAIGVGSVAGAENGNLPDWAKWGGLLALPAFAMSRPGSALLSSMSPGGAARGLLGNAMTTGPASAASGLLSH